MYINNIKLRNFRNYDLANINFSKNYNIIYGDNAQGKTNILEAIFMCSSGRSHRTSKDSDLVKFGETGYYVGLNFTKESRQSNIELIYEKDQKKRIRLNEIPAKKIGELIGYLNTVIFSPEDLLIIKEGPSERRRFIDITISQLKPYYFYDLQQYQKILTQRNSLLKELQNRNNMIDTLEIWNNKLVSIGSKIIKTRFEFINRLSEKAANKHLKISSGNENLELKYAPSFNIENYESIQNIEKNFLKNLEFSYKREIMKGTTLYGPQRDDYEIFLNHLSLKNYGSQGQQRTAILSIKLSEIDIMKDDVGEYPVLLLDDVMSELDKKRQEFLLGNLSNIQTFITSTEKLNIDRCNQTESLYLNVAGGNVSLQEV